MSNVHFHNLSKQDVQISRLNDFCAVEIETTLRGSLERLAQRNSNNLFARPEKAETTNGRLTLTSYYVFIFELMASRQESVHI